jgi:ABC-type Fe3+/spermidine/putrescine transport system ATPase subunit
MLRLENITKNFNNFNITNFNLNVEKGEFLTLLGSSGSGKSTILKLIAGLDKDYSGDIILNNKNYLKTKLIDRKISMVFQDSLLFPHMNVEENTAFGLKMTGVNKKERLKKANEILADVGLRDFGKRSIHELSGGQKQRVAIARALVVNPEIILMDEPFSALDRNLRLNMQELIKKLHKERDITIIFVTHDQEEAFYLSSHIVIINEGSIVQKGIAQDIFRNPSGEFVANFLGIKNIIHGKIKNHLFKTEDFQIKIDIESCKNAILFIRETDIEITTTKSDLEGIVQDTVFKNGFNYIKVKVNSQTFYIIQNGNYVDKLKEGDIVQLKFDINKINVMNNCENNQNI